MDLNCRSHSIGRLPTPLFSSSVISESTAGSGSVGVFLDAFHRAWYRSVPGDDADDCASSCTVAGRVPMNHPDGVLEVRQPVLMACLVENKQHAEWDVRALILERLRQIGGFYALA